MDVIRVWQREIETAFRYLAASCCPQVPKSVTSLAQDPSTCMLLARDDVVTDLSYTCLSMYERTVLQCHESLARRLEEKLPEHGHITRSWVYGNKQSSCLCWRQDVLQKRSGSVLSGSGLLPAWDTVISPYLVVHITHGMKSHGLTTALPSQRP